MKRFWSKVAQTAKSGDLCWLWTGRRNMHGYGHFRLGARVVSAHRVAWEETNGPIPTGMGVLHRCDNPSCVRPSYLFLGDQRLNMQDCASKGRIATGTRHGRWKHGRRAKLVNRGL